jgi:hypothetical protein
MTPNNQRCENSIFYKEKQKGEGVGRRKKGRRVEK